MLSPRRVCEVDVGCRASRRRLRHAAPEVVRSGLERVAQGRRIPVHLVVLYLVLEPAAFVQADVDRVRSLRGRLDPHAVSSQSRSARSRGWKLKIHDGPRRVVLTKGEFAPGPLNRPINHP